MEEANVAPSGVLRREPPKGWEEITLEEKVERMREIIKQYQKDLSYKNRQIDHLRNLIFQHQHVDGKLLIEADRWANGGLENDCCTTSSELSNRKPYF